MLQALFSELSSVISAFVSMLSSAFEQIIGMIYSGDKLTTFGQLMLIGVGIGIFYFVFSWIRSLIAIKAR
jgi:hypothetical protein